MVRGFRKENRLGFFFFRGFKENVDVKVEEWFSEINVLFL